VRPRLRVHIRAYCYGCRRRLGRGWHSYHATQGGHQWRWEYTIRVDDLFNLHQAQGFRNWWRAQRSARRAYDRLAFTLSHGVCETAYPDGSTQP